MSGIIADQIMVDVNDHALDLSNGCAKILPDRTDDATGFEQGKRSSFFHIAGSLVSKDLFTPFLVPDTEMLPDADSQDLDDPRDTTTNSRGDHHIQGHVCACGLFLEKSVDKVADMMKALTIVDCSSPSIDQVTVALDDLKLDDIIVCSQCVGTITEAMSVLSLTEPLPSEMDDGPQKTGALSAI